MPALLLICLALPTALSTHMGDLLITPYRVVCIVAFFLMLGRLRSGAISWKATDVLVIFYATWGTLCFFANSAIGSAAQSSGSLILESIVPYFMGRVYVSSPRQLRRAAHVMMYIVWGLLPLAAIEAALRVHYIQGILGQTPGAVIPRVDIRLGMLRAMATFDHPILFGAFCASTFSLAWYVLPLRYRAWNALAILGCVFFSASSGPLLALVLQAGLIGWEWLTRRVAHRWLLLTLGIVAALFIVNFLSNRTVGEIIVSSLTLNPQTGWIRFFQWDYGWRNIDRNWLVGLGNRDWAHPLWLGRSVDDFWLLEGIRFGLPGMIAAVGTIPLAVWRVNAAAEKKNADIGALHAWSFTLVSLLFIGFTVDFWTSMHALLFFLMGIGMFLGDQITRSSTRTCVHGLPRQI